MNVMSSRSLESLSLFLISFLFLFIFSFFCSLLLWFNLFQVKIIKMINNHNIQSDDSMKRFSSFHIIYRRQLQTDFKPFQTHETY